MLNFSQCYFELTPLELDKLEIKELLNNTENQNF
jgi:hypothetical protein